MTTTSHRSHQCLLALSLGLAPLVGCDVEPSDAGLDDERELDEASEDEDLGEAPLDAARPDAVSERPDLYDTVSAPINLALGKPTSQSTTDFGGASSRAVDGNTDGSFWNGSVTHTLLDAPGWWQVDLQAVEPIGEIMIHNRTDCCAKLRNFDVRVSADGTTWETFHQAGVAGGRTRVLVDRKARYVRIENPDTLHVAEVEVLRTRNLAFGRPASQSGTGFGAPASRAVDGSTDGHFGHGSVSHTDVDGPNQWWQVDLESVQNVGQVVLFNRTDCCAQKLHDFTVAVSNDGVHWDDHDFAGPAASHVLVPINRDARYVRVSNGSGYLHLAEVQVFEQPRLPGLSYDRGVGTVPAYGCETGDQYDAGLCYAPCSAGYTNVLTVCYESCAAGYTDMGLYCMNYNVAGWPSYWKHTYDRGVGTLPVPTCGPGQQLDAGLCYPTCDVGFAGVGPVCWLEGIGAEDIAAGACELLRAPIVSSLAEETGKALTFGTGLGLAAGATATGEIGMAYGADGEFGCYVAGCLGMTTNVSLSAYGVLGAYEEFSSIAGDSLVASAGLSVGIPETPIAVGGSLGIVTDLQGTPTGATLSASISVGADALTPIDLGALACHTEVLQTQ